MSVKDLADRLGKEKAWRLRREIDRGQQGDPSGRHVVPVTSALVRAGGEEESPLGMDSVLQSIAAQYEVRGTYLILVRSLLSLIGMFLLLSVFLLSLTPSVCISMPSQKWHR